MKISVKTTILINMVVRLIWDTMVKSLMILNIMEVVVATIVSLCMLRMRILSVCINWMNML